MPCYVQHMIFNRCSTLWRRNGKQSEIAKRLGPRHKLISYSQPHDGKLYATAKRPGPRHKLISYWHLLLATSRRQANCNCNEAPSKTRAHLPLHLLLPSARHLQHAVALASGTKSCKPPPPRAARRKWPRRRNVSSPVVP